MRDYTLCNGDDFAGARKSVSVGVDDGLTLRIITN
jgi:hypothetical protein